MKYKNSQTSLEFVILVCFLLFFFTAFFLTIHETMSDKIKEKHALLVMEVASTVQDEINLAFESIDGYSREFKIPENIASKNYDIIITDNLVYVKTEDDKQAVALPVRNITGQIKKGENIIKKVEGIVKLNI